VRTNDPAEAPRRSRPRIRPSSPGAGAGPRRGELIRLFGEELRAAKADLGRLVTLEAGKIVSEGLGEVQEMIDICDFAVGLSRQLYGLTIATERADHRMMETWQPLGVVGVISAFNFPVAVWAWNAALALVCGDPVVWKPSEKTPLTALATQACSTAPPPASAAPGRPVDPADRRQARSAIAGRSSQVADCCRPPARPAWAARSGPGSPPAFRPFDPGAGRQQRRHRRPSANLDLALRAIVFSAMGTAGQRCTTCAACSSMTASMTRWCRG
jgi:aldehyde dehydrogenase (NAD+)